MAYATVILSDLHLGAANSRGEELLRFLNALDADHMIINGDLFDRPHLGRLRDIDLQILAALRHFGQDRHLEYLVGNHDPSPAYFRSVLGVDAKDQTVVDVGERRYLVAHGHAWDKAMGLPRWIIGGADGIYRASQCLDRSHRFARFLKRRCKRFVKAVDHLRDRALAEAKLLGFGGVVLGHSHVHSDQMIDGVHYLNSGCWTENPSTYIAVREGIARLEHFTSHRATAEPQLLPSRWIRRRAISTPMPAPLSMGERA